MSGRLPRLAGVVATVNTAGEGFIVCPVIGFAEAGFTAVVNGINQTRAFQFVLPVRITFSKMVIEITGAGAAGKKFGAGIYDKDKNLIIETGALAADATGVISTNVTTTILEPGVYWSAQTADDIAVLATGMLASVAAFLGLISENTVRAGWANASSAGVLPATLGTITANTARHPVFIVLEP